MTATVVKCACLSCTCEVSSSSAISRNGQSFCSDSCASGHPNNEPCHDAAGACGCTCGPWPRLREWHPSFSSPHFDQPNSLHEPRPRLNACCVAGQQSFHQRDVLLIHDQLTTSPQPLKQQPGQQNKSTAVNTTDVSETMQRGTSVVLFAWAILRYWKTNVWMNRCGITCTLLPPPIRFENPAFRG